MEAWFTNVQKAMMDILSWKCLSCFGYTINLCVKAGLKQCQVEMAMICYPHLVTFFHKSSKATHTCLQHQTRGTDKPKLRKWTLGGTRHMICDIAASLSIPISATMSEMKWTYLLPKDTKCRLLEEMLQVLKLFKNVMVQVSAAEYVTTSAIQPHWECRM